MLPKSSFKDYDEDISKLSIYSICEQLDPRNIDVLKNQNVVQTLFDSLKDPTTEKVELKTIIDLIIQSGIQLDDPRVSPFFKKLNKSRGGSKNVGLIQNFTMEYDEFVEYIQDSISIMVKILTNDFCIPRFVDFSKEITEIFDSCAAIGSGENAAYIPQLADINPDYWGCAICTVDGQKILLGDATQPFTIQSTSKPLCYALAITESGSDEVHKYVGYEPSGHKFNSVILNSDNKPHNPLINSGAIAVVSLLGRNLSLPQRFIHINKKLTNMAGGMSLGFNNAVYLSERSTADRNYSIAYYMREHNCFPPNTSLNEIMDLYFQLCSIESNCQAMSVIAATFATGGINPITGRRELSGTAVRDTLSLMHSCGMYDYSGQFAFQVGIPAKSGVSGVIIAVIPNLMGIALYSPRIDVNGNSRRGLEFCKELVRRFVFHNYDSLLHSVAKNDPRKMIHDDVTHAVVRLHFAAKQNDIGELRRCYISEVDFDTCDYDGRTALHIAATNGAYQAVRFCLEIAKVNPAPKDMWDRTPLDNAITFKHDKIVELIKKYEKKKPSNTETITSGISTVDFENLKLENFTNGPDSIHNTLSKHID